MNRSLYQCSHAKVNKRIHCQCGHALASNSITLNIERLIRGESLECTNCQECPDYDEMGGPVEAKDRGWAKERTQ